MRSSQVRESCITPEGTNHTLVQGLWLFNVRNVYFCYQFELTYYHHRFLYADPTPGALEVFLDQPGYVVQTSSDLPPGENVEQGVWIKADPLSGCVVCNIGESEYKKRIVYFTVVNLGHL